RCLRQRNCIGMVAEQGEKVVGFMIYELHKAKLHILNFAVHPGCRRLGVGAQMVQKLISKLSSHRRTRITLEVRETNLGALLYFDRWTAWTGYRPTPRAIPGTHAPAFVHPPKPHPARPAWPYPSRSVLGIVFLLGLSLLAAAWNAHTQLPPTLPAQGIDLRAESAGPKVNTTSAEPPPAPPAALVEHQTLKVAFAPPQPEVPALLPLPSQLPAVEPPEPPAAEDPKTLVPLVDYGPGSLACSCFRDMQPGDTHMKRNWNVLKLSSLLAVAVAVTPLPASATPPPGGPTEFGQGDIKELREAIDKKLDKLIEALTN